MCDLKILTGLDHSMRVTSKSSENEKELNSLRRKKKKWRDTYTKLKSESILRNNFRNSLQNPLSCQVLRTATCCVLNVKLEYRLHDTFDYSFNVY